MIVVVVIMTFLYFIVSRVVQHYDLLQILQRIL